VIPGWTTAGVPVTPDRDTAREWAVRELADPAYARAEPSPVARALEWLLDTLSDLLDSLPGSPSTGGAVAAGILALVAVAVIAWIVAGPARRSARVPAGRDVFGDTALTADQHRALARDAAAEARWREAVQEAFRGLARGLEERAVLDVRPGRTAEEIARGAAAAFPDLGDELEVAARHFDDVAYGGRPGSRAAYDAVSGTDTRVGRTRPEHGASVATPAVPA
jgi:hypothetical protein